MNSFSKLRAMKTLLVDDDDFIRDSLKIVFHNQGCFLQTAVNAEEGLKALEREKFNIVLSDARLPGKDGLSFLKSVGIVQPDTLRVLITSYGDKSCTSMESAGCVHEYIEKPFSVESLAKSLAVLTRHQLIL
jgi:DNA-binding NtrC family response regulator